MQVGSHLTSGRAKTAHTDSSEHAHADLMREIQRKEELYDVIAKAEYIASFMTSDWLNRLLLQHLSAQVDLRPWDSRGTGCGSRGWRTVWWRQL